MSEQTLNVDMKPGLPDGMLALLFTDIEGSTALLHELSDGYVEYFQAHQRILRAAFAAHEGIEVDTQGDAFFAVFHDVHKAVAAIVQAQRELQAFPWPVGLPLQVRMGLHCGEPTPIGTDYVGIDLHRTARLMSAAHGGQVLLSSAAVAFLNDELPDCTIRDRGAHRLKDFPRPETIFELCIEGLPAEFPPLRTLNHRLHNLPERLLPILGRERELETIGALLKSGQRLTTLLGPGGSGKTRLSLEIADRTLDLWEGGVCFVPLAPVPLPDRSLALEAVKDAIVGAVAREFGLRDDGAQNLGEQLVARLNGPKMLLVLDNFEHLVSGAGIVAHWSAHCPNLQILATSRVPLNLRGEQQIPIAPLALPQRNPAPDAAELGQCAAVALFVARARAVKPDFSVNEENAVALAEICRRLDGLPLAIELAAARIKLLPPAMMLDRLGKGLSFLVGGARDMAARQRTLRAAIAWSYDLLDDEEKCLFRRLGVFRGGFDFASAEQVCKDSTAQFDVFDAVNSLLNQSLLVRYDDVDDQPRFGMLETIRQFALEELEAASEIETLRERHLAWCFESTQLREAEMSSALEHSLRLFEVEADNWRAAWNWSLGARPADALQLTAGATVLWNRLGNTNEQFERLEAVLRAAPTGEVTARCRALHFLVQAERNRANWSSHAVRLQELDTLANEAQLPEFQAIAHDQRMWDAVKEGRIEAALHHGTEVLALRNLCVEQAREHTLDVQEVKRYEAELNDAMILHVEILTKAGRIDEAYALMEESLALKRASNDESGLTFGLNKYGQLLADTGHIAQARSIFEEVLQRAEASGDRSVVLGWYRYDAALMALHEGDLVRARELIRASYTNYVENSAYSGFVLILNLLVYLYALEGNWSLVARMLGAGDATRAGYYNDDWQTILKAQETAARMALGAEEFEAQYVSGSRLKPQQAIESALP